MLINAYVAHARTAGSAGTSRTSRPGSDARGFVAEGALPPDVETHLVNAVLTNGARYYVDHAHPEISTPECADAREVVVFDRAAEEILRASMAGGRSRCCPPGAEIVVYKNNSDGKGNSYGCHENYLMARERAVRAASSPRSRRTSSPARCSAAPARSGCEAPGVGAPTGAVPAQPAGRLLRGGGRARDHAEAARSSTPATSRTATARSTGAST